MKLVSNHRPIWIVFLLSYVPFYGLYLIYRNLKELNEHLNLGISPIKRTLLCFVPVVGFVAYFQLICKHMKGFSWLLYSLVGVAPFFHMSLISLPTVYTQVCMNNYWDEQQNLPIRKWPTIPETFIIVFWYAILLMIAVLCFIAKWAAALNTTPSSVQYLSNPWII